MPEPAEAAGPLFSGRPQRSVDIVRSTHTSELVLALCGPIGTPLHLVAEELKNTLRDRFDYNPVTIRLSKFIEQYGEDFAADDCYSRVKNLIREGDKLREMHGGSVLAELAVREISVARLKRREETDERRHEPARVCHIIDSIKNQEELDILRLVYRDMLHCIGVVSPLGFRVGELEQKGMSQAEIFDLVDQDSGEEFSHGQTVRDTFPQADFFLRVDSNVTSAIQKKLERYLNIVLEAQIETPTPHETAMYHAASAATNSACLSRQVGAAITDKAGTVLSIGWNDVPRAGGGLYTASASRPEQDNRCKALGHGACQNDRMMDELADDVVKMMSDEDVLDEPGKTKTKAIILESRVGDLLEFSRAIHAEMHALIGGAQKTADRMVDGKLFVSLR